MMACIVCGDLSKGGPCGHHTRREVALAVERLAKRLGTKRKAERLPKLPEESSLRRPFQGGLCVGR